MLLQVRRGKPRQTTSRIITLGRVLNCRLGVISEQCVNLRLTSQKMDQADDRSTTGCYRAEVVLVRLDLHLELAGISSEKQSQSAVVDRTVLLARLVS